MVRSHLFDLTFVGQHRYPGIKTAKICPNIGHGQPHIRSFALCLCVDCTKLPRHSGAGDRVTKVSPPCRRIAIIADHDARRGNTS
jgi:hypothetical protein